MGRDTNSKRDGRVLQQNDDTITPFKPGYGFPSDCTMLWSQLRHGLILIFDCSPLAIGEVPTQVEGNGDRRLPSCLPACRMVFYSRLWCQPGYSCYISLVAEPAVLIHYECLASGSKATTRKWIAVETVGMKWISDVELRAEELK